MCRLRDTEEQAFLDRWRKARMQSVHAQSQQDANIKSKSISFRTQVLYSAQTCSWNILPEKEQKRVNITLFTFKTNRKYK